MTVAANLNYTGWEIQVFVVDLAGWLKLSIRRGQLGIGGYGQGI